MKKIRAASRPLKGSVQVPGDKSIGHRALMLGALAEEGLLIRGLPDGQDVRSTRRCLEALGTRMEDGPDGLRVHGGALSKPWPSPKQPLDCGNSGTTIRLMMGILAGMPLEATLFGDASLSSRPMGRVAEPLRAMGGDIELLNGKFAPVKVRGKRPLQPALYRLPVPSAQVKSAILLAALSASGGTTVVDPFGARDHTERMLNWLSPGMIHREGPNIRLTPGTLKGGGALKVPGDISSASFFLAAASMVKRSDVSIPGVGINPSRMGFIEALKEMGASIELLNRREEAGEPVADLRVRAAQLKSITVPASRIPALVDEVPLLAVVAAAGRKTSRIEGLGELRLKESDRLEGTASGLRSMGIDARVDGDALEIKGGEFRGAAIETLGDHRLAMAFTVAALTASGDTRLSDAECASISYPGFYSDLEALQ
ncbi:MAG: 3-phosphoshikimate 1-carboxyvinyltransferase [Proteobacteria bacterium]|nr:3-phosphoshikimate 1-carboxyvinyltransferase [Pseudomonadota bacterium]